MAAYFTGGGAGTDVVQAAGTDSLQTLYLMNPSYVGFTDAAAAHGGGAAAANMVFLNSAVSTLTPASFGHQPTPVAQHFVGIPLQPAPQSGYNLWGPDATGGNDVSPPRHGAQQHAPAAGTSAAAAAAVSPVLSLSSREAAPPVTVASAAAVPGGTEQEQQVVMRSRYLKAAQELLDEAVSVSKGAATAVKKKEGSEGGVSGGGAGGVDDGGGSKSGVAGEMSTAERQELQMKKSKLLNMLDEVEQRYRQYHRQMQAVAAAFEAAAGAGSATTYTSLALRTISRQFRCLRDAIAAQVRAASRGLGEDYGGDDEDGSGGGRTTVGSRLRFIDHQLRQQRAMQQLGMVHAAAAGGPAGGGWRPQRGLPERAVSVLRAWLFEHFLHPYPKDSDKVMLAKQTGLTRSQVSNWFINARVRLWKPMVEEMYAEETKAKEEEHDAAAAAGGDGGGGSNGSVAEQAPSKPDDSAGIGMSSSSPAAAAASRSVGVHAGDQQAQASFYGGGGGGDDPFQCRIKKTRTTTADEAAAAAFHVTGEAAVSHRELLMKFMEAGGEGVRSGHPHVIDDDDDVAAAGAGGYSLFTPAPYGHQFGSDHFAFAGHGGGGGGMSLTLGLPHGADQTPASFLMGAGSDGGGAPVTTAGYDMNMQSTKSLAAQLMRDFVA
uniref:Homeobox domain-containing protein n=1 Tax=Oryza meridionalis TaxID=40149 RepID=A0A0E0F9N8_9ORYZ